MRHDYDYIVLGLGGIGSAAAYWLARRAGADVLGLEQFAIGHSRGASQDHSRIIRLSYHTPGYVTLAREAYRAWAALERDSGAICRNVTPRSSRASRSSARRSASIRFGMPFV